LRALALGMVMVVVLFLFVPCYVVPVNAAGEIFSDGFESGDFSAWTGTTVTPDYGNLTVSSDKVYQGSFAARAEVLSQRAWTHAFAYKTFTERSSVYTRLYLYVEDFSTSYYFRGFVEYIGTSLQVAKVGLRSDRALWLYYWSEGTYHELISSTIIPLQSWVCLEFKTVISGTDGEYRVWKDGMEVTDLTVTGLNNSYAGNIRKVGCGIVGAYGVNGTVYIDCVKIADMYVGPKYLVTFYQTGLDETAVGTVVTVDGSLETFADLPYSMWVDENTQVSYKYESLMASSVSSKRFALIDVTGPASPFTVTSSVNVTGNYETQYYLTVQTDPLGLATIPGEGWYDYCEIVELTAPTAVGYDFSYWDVDGGTVPGNPIQVHMDGPHTATAHYIEIPPLSVSISPATAKIKIGESVAFTSDVSGGKALYSYQWYLNGSAVSGATDSTWTFAPETTGFYTVYLVVTDSLGSTAQSDEASVNVAPKLLVSISPTSASIFVGESVEFASTVSGGYPPYSYQWYLDDSAVSGATSKTWTFTPTASGMYYVYLKVTDDNDNVVQSETARITVSEVPVGGYSVSLSKNVPTLGLINYSVVIALFGVALSLLRRKRK